MTDFTVIRRKTNQVAHSSRNKQYERTPQGKHYFQFLEMVEGGGKIGTIIKNLSQIRQNAGGGAFIIYKCETEATAGKFGEWMAGQKNLLTVRTHGAGWYIWAYTATAAVQATGMLKDVETEYLAKQQTFTHARRTGEAMVPVPVPVVVTPIQDQLYETEFPAIGKKVMQHHTSGAWSKGTPQPVQQVVETPAEKKVEVVRKLVFTMPPRPVVRRLKPVLEPVVETVYEQDDDDEDAWSECEEGKDSWDD